MTNESLTEEIIHNDFRHYRSLGATLVGILIPLSSSILLAVLISDLKVHGPWSYLLIAALISVFLALVSALVTLYCFFRGYFEKANEKFSTNTLKPDLIFRRAEKWLIITLSLFFLGSFVFLGFLLVKFID